MTVFVGFKPIYTVGLTSEYSQDCCASFLLFMNTKNRNIFKQMVLPVSPFTVYELLCVCNIQKFRCSVYIVLLLGCEILSIFEMFKSLM